MRLAVYAEWTKLRTVAGSGWLLVGAAAVTIAMSAAAAGAMSCSGVGCTVDAPRISLTGVQLGQAVVAVLAVLTVGGEYSTGLIRTTLTAMPRRGVVLAAKAVTVTGLVLMAGTVAVAGSLLAGRIILPGHGFTAAHGYPPLSLMDGPTLRAAAGSVLYLGLVGLLSLGIATVVRDPAPAVGLVLALLYMFPILIHVVTDPRWVRRLQQWSPSNAGLAVQATRNLDTLPIGPWAGLGVLAAWAAAALLAGGLLLRLRDA
jgi:ABC-2 type transport system permease protein